MYRNILTLAVVLFVAVLLVGCNSKAIDEQYAKEAKRVWKITPEGVKYFTTCAEGFLFLGTKSTHMFDQLAGPIGKCKSGE
jgi:hypothetical protein